jgi:hypothetical protein
MLRALRLSCLSAFVLVLAVVAPAEAFPEWEQKPPASWGPVVAQSALISAGSIKIVIDNKANHCGLKGGALVKNVGGHGYLATEGVNGGCTGSTGNTECTPASNLQVFFKSWEAELVGAVFALSSAPTEVEVRCAAGTPGPAIGLYTGLLEPMVKPNVLKFVGAASGTLTLSTHTLDLVGKMKLVPTGPATKLRGS